MVVECKKRNITNTVQMEGYRNRTIVVNGGNKLMTCERITWGAWTSRYIKAGSFMFNPFTQSNVMLSWRRKFSFADVKLSKELFLWLVLLCVPGSGCFYVLCTSFGV